MWGGKKRKKKESRKGGLERHPDFQGHTKIKGVAPTEEYFGASQKKGGEDQKAKGGPPEPIQKGGAPERWGIPNKPSGQGTRKN